MSDVTLKLLLLGEDRASKAFKSAGDSASESGSKMKRNYAAGVLVAATAVAGFAKLSVDKFKEVGAETLGLQRVMGGTAESASRLRFAAQMSGVSFETLQKSTGKFSKALDAARGTAKGTAAMVKLLGTNFLDAHGHILPMDQLLPRVSDKFKSMPSGAEKTALAMKLFGKAGADMLPFLNKGASAISGLEHESDKFGLTLSGKNLDALKKSKAGQREWNASLDGLKVQFGAQILPLLNTFVGFLRDHVIPVVTQVTGFLQKHAGVAKILGVVLVTLIVGLKALAIAQGLVNAVMALNPIGLVVIAIVALAAGIIYAYKHSETFRNIVNSAFRVVGAAIAWCRDHWKLLISIILGPFGVAIAMVATHFSAIKTVAMEAIKFVVNIFLTMVSSIIHAAATAFGWVPGLGGKLKSAAKAFDQFKADVNSALSGINDKTVNVTVAMDAATAAILRQGNVNKTIGMKGYASGGMNIPDGVFTTGEAGFEVMRKSGSRLDILSNSQARRSLTGGSTSAGASSIPVQIIVQMDGRNVASSLERVSHAGPPLRIRVAS